MTLDPNSPAFPYFDGLETSFPGLSIRQELAARFAVGCIAATNYNDDDIMPYAFELADKFIAENNKETKP